MNVSSIPRMPFSPDATWPELERIDSNITRLFWLLVVPLSLLPPAMIYFAGTSYGDAFFTGYGSKPWAMIASIFFVCELISVTWMGWLIRRVALAWNERISHRNAYLVAVIAAIPLWISSLGLFVASTAFNVALDVVALILSCGLVLQGVRSFCHIVNENIEQAISITRLAFGGGLFAWGILMLLIII